MNLKTKNLVLSAATILCVVSFLAFILGLVLMTGINPLQPMLKQPSAQIGSWLCGFGITAGVSTCLFYVFIGQAWQKEIECANKKLSTLAVH